jgi:hypothetical protein
MNKVGSIRTKIIDHEICQQICIKTASCVYNVSTFVYRNVLFWLVSLYIMGQTRCRFG